MNKLCYQVYTDGIDNELKSWFTTVLGRPADFLDHPKISDKRLLNAYIVRSMEHCTVNIRGLYRIDNTNRVIKKIMNDPVIGILLYLSEKGMSEVKSAIVYHVNDGNTSDIAIVKRSRMKKGLDRMFFKYPVSEKLLCRYDDLRILVELLYRAAVENLNG